MSHGDRSVLTSARPRLLLLPALTLLFSFFAHADDPAPMQWTAAHAQLLDAGDAASGQQLSAKCDRCHGANGVSQDSDMPHLAGQTIRYLYKQLQDFRSQARVDSGMNRRARKLSDQDIADLAAWYASLELPAMLEERKLDPPTLVTNGDPARAIPACQGCHGVDGRGLGKDHDMPALAGMPYDYFLLTMQAFRDGSRSNDLGGVVRRFVGQISDDEVRVLAKYYLALGRRERPALP